MSTSLYQWLRALGLEHHHETLSDQEVDFEVLVDLAELDLAQLGIPLGARRKLLKAVAQLESAAAPSHGGAPIEAVTPTKAPFEEHRPLTILFCDLVGSTELSLKYDADDMNVILDAYQGCASTILGRYDGYVARFLGDGIMAYFGYPRALEDAAERAIRAALEIVTSVAALRPLPGLTLAVRIGIASGPVLLRKLASGDDHKELSAVGVIPNLAARMQALAEPGAVVLSPSAHRLTAGTFEFTDLGPRETKGFPQPVNVWRVDRPIPTDRRLQPGRTAERKIVDRLDELDLLRDRLQAASAGVGQVVFMYAEAGMGKSRLVQALLDDDGPPSRSCWLIQCSAFHRSTALHPVIEFVRRAASIHDGDDHATRLLKLARFVPLQVPGHAEVLGVLGSLVLGVEGDAAPQLRLSSQARKDRTRSALVDIAIHESRMRPFVLLVEDVHWIDPTTAEFIAALCARASEMAVLIVVTSRSRQSLARLGATGAVEIELQPLGDGDSQALLGEIVPGADLVDDLRDDVIDKAGGVPLFLEELAKAVAHWPETTPGTSANQASMGFGGTAIPATLHDSLVVRLDQVASARQTAQVCATIGRTFSMALLLAVSEHSAARIWEDVDALLGAEIMVTVDDPGRLRFSFKHALLRDAAYESQPKSQRQSLHRRIALAIDQHFPTQTIEEPEVLARHYEAGEDPRRAVESWMRAARQATSRSAYREATSIAQRALALVDGMDGDDDQLELRLSITNFLAFTTSANKGLAAPEVGRMYQQVLDLCHSGQHLEQHLRALNGQVAFCFNAGLYPQAQSHASSYLQLVDGVGGELHRANAHSAMGSILLVRGRLAVARQHFRSAIDAYVPAADGGQAGRFGADQKCRSLAFLGYTLYLLGNPDQAVDAAQEGIAHARDLGDPSNHCLSLHWLGMVQRELRDFASVRTTTAAVLELSQRYGFRLWNTAASLHHGAALVELGEHDAGLRMANRGLAGWQESGSAVMLPKALMILARSLLVSGDPDGAAQETERAISIARTNGDLESLPALLILAAALPGQHGGGDGERTLIAAYRLAQRQGAMMWQLEAQTALARKRSAEGRVAEARNGLRPAYAAFTEGFETRPLLDAKAVLDGLGGGRG